MTVLDMSDDTGEEAKHLEPKTKEIEIQNDKKKKKKRKKEKEKEKEKEEDTLQPPETPATIIRLRKLGINTVYCDRENELASGKRNYSSNESQTSSEDGDDDDDDNLDRETSRTADSDRMNRRQTDSNGTTALEKGPVETVPRNSEEEEEEDEEVEEDKKRSDDSNSKKDEEVKEKEDGKKKSADRRKIPSLDAAKSDSAGDRSADKEQIRRCRKTRPPSVSSSSSGESDNDDTGSSDDNDDDDTTFHLNGGYFDLYLEELFGKILRQRGGGREGGGGGGGGGGRGKPTGDDHSPVHHRGDDVKSSSKPRKGGRSDGEKRRSDRSRPAVYEASDVHQVLPSTRSPSRSNLRSQGRPSSALSASSSSGKVVRFVEEDPRAEADETVSEQLWRDKVEALGQLNHKRLARRVPRRAVYGRKPRSDHHHHRGRYYNNNNNDNDNNNNYTDLFARRYLLPPVRKYATTSQDHFHSSAAKTGFFSPKTNSTGDNNNNNWVSSLRSGNFAADGVRLVDWMEDPEHPGIVRSQFYDGSSNPYNRQLRTGWTSILGSQKKNPDALQEKKERNAMRFEYGRYMREINRIRTPD